MMRHVLFIGNTVFLGNIQFPQTMVKGKQCMLYNVFADDICIVKHSNCKTWQQFGRTEGSITKDALIGTYEHLWGICD